MLSFNGLNAWWKKLASMFGADTFNRILYLSGIDYGVSAAKDYSEILRLSGRALAEKLAEAATEAGWGSVTIVKMDERGLDYTFRIEDCWEARAKGVSPCNFISGVLAGIHKTIFDLPAARCFEAICTADGHPYCEFRVTGPP